MKYIAELRRFLKSSSYPLGTLGYLDVFKLDEYSNPFGEPVFSCVTLEPSIPVVPVGCHNLSLTYSPRFSPRMPYRLYRGVPLIYSPDCPERRGVRIHIGNTVKDTRGCILLGSDFSQDGIINSRQSFIDFMKIASETSKINFYGPY